MWLAEMETEHYSWQALGLTRDEALEALAAGWSAHREQLAEDGELLMLPAAALAHYEPHVVELRPGVCLRDGSEIASVTA